MSEGIKAGAVNAFKYFILPLSVVFLSEPMYRNHFYE